MVVQNMTRKNVAFVNEILNMPYDSYCWSDNLRVIYTMYCSIPNHIRNNSYNLGWINNQLGSNQKEM